MSKKSRKKEREEAVRREVARREALRRERCPLDFEAFLSLVEFVAERIEQSGHQSGKLDHVLAWAQAASTEAGQLLEFLSGERIEDDWSLVVEADPYVLFGARDGRHAWMPIDAETLQELLDDLDEHLESVGCDHTQRFARRWLARRGLPVGATCMALLAKGGGCDCEIALNVELESIFAAARPD